jgi:aspartyl-tRNA(Asn)/glutamyl-tRNA(Gln) amidotransferase subunit B
MRSSATQQQDLLGRATAYGAEPNTQACLIDLGMPGTLPVLNAEAVRMAIKFRPGDRRQVAPRSVFARKNYFYPDLPKGYQISQYELPVVGKAASSTSPGRRQRQAHRHHPRASGRRRRQELHEDFPRRDGIDLNRAGTPLLEIVSEPDMRSAKEAVAYL